MSSSYMQKNRTNLLIFFAAILMIVMRYVDLFINPRFWAEEGREYFVDAYTHGIASLFHGHMGYYSLIPNVATYCATLVSLEYAPSVTTSFAFFIQIVPFYLICISKSEFLNSSPKKLFASLIVLFVGHTPEIWLNTITSQFHFIIILFLILIDDKNKLGMARTYLFYFVALISGMSGVPSNILAPLFLYQYFLTKNKVNIHILLLLALTTSIQILVILKSSGLSRVQHADYAVVGNIFVSMLQHPVFQSFDVGIYTLSILPLAYLVIKFISQKKYFLLFFGTSFFLTFIMVTTSVGMEGAKRYVYAPGVIFMLGLLVASFDSSLSKITRGTLILYTSIAVFLGMRNYPLEDGFVVAKNWRKWKEEVMLYNAKSIDALAIYPQWENDYWAIALPRK